MESELSVGAQSPLQIATLGPLEIRYEGRLLQESLPLKGQALLVYLALTAQPTARTTLAGLLWPDILEESARTNLRITLSRLRRQLPMEALDATRQTIAFDHAQSLHVDALALQALASRLESAAQSALEAVLHNVRGEFLQNFDVGDAPAFEQWMLARRQHYRQLVLDAYTHLLLAARRRADFPHAIQLARRLLTLEPWYEEAHRQLMLLLTLSGQRSAALAQFEDCRRLLHQELAVEPGAETVALYEQIRDDRLPQQLDLPGGATSIHQETPSITLLRIPGNTDAPPSALPPQRTPFIGRQVELALLQDRVLDPDYRLVTIVGEGGAGKTRLALALADRLRARPRDGEPQGVFADGLFFTSLTDVPASGLQIGGEETLAGAGLHLVTALSATLGLNFATAQEPRIQLLSYLRHKACLLILDNFESFAASSANAAAAFLLDLLDHAPRVTMLVTSRLPLNLQAEYLFRLTGLPVPQEDQPHEISAHDSLLLFSERAERAVGRPLSIEQDLPHILKICRAVNGLPLAIELAASWMRWHTPQEIAEALANPHAFEAGELPANAPADIAPRHRSLEVVFDHSWQMLAPPARLLLAQLSHFQGPFSAAAALFVTQSTRAELATLVDSSLVQRSLEGYYECHGLVRRFAAARLTSLDMDHEALRRRHTSYYMTFIGDMAAPLTGREPRAALRRVQAEADNILTALQLVITTPYPEQLARGLPGLVEYWTITGLFREARNALLEALQRLQASPLPPDSALLCRLYAEYAGFLFEIGLYEEAEREARRAVEMADQEKLAALSAPARLALGHAFWGQGRFEHARAQFEQALPAARQAADAATEAVVLRNLAAVYWRNGDLAQAGAYCREARNLNHELGNVRNESRDLLMLGILADNELRYDDAHRMFEQVLHLGQKSGDRRLTMAAYAEIGVTATHQGHLDRALHYLQQNLAMVSETGSLWHEGVTTANLGDLKLKLGDFDGAETAYHTALAMAREAGAPALESNILSFWSLLEHMRHRYDAGIKHARQSLDIALKMNVPRELAFARQFLAHNLLSEGQFDEARQQYQEAYDAWQALQHPARAFEALAGLAAVTLASGEMSTAIAHAGDLFVHLQNGELTGADDPSRVYLACQDVFAAVDDRRARLVLQLGLDRLNARATQISDAALRRSFLQNIPSNARLHRLALSASID